MNNQETAKFNQLLGLEIKSWIPVAVLFISAISFFVYQSARINALEAKAQEAKTETADMINVLNELRVEVARTGVKVDTLTVEIKEIKQDLNNKK